MRQTLALPLVGLFALPLSGCWLLSGPFDDRQEESSEGEGEGEGDPQPTSCADDLACGDGSYCFYVRPGLGFCLANEDVCGYALQSECDDDSDCQEGLRCGYLVQGEDNVRMCVVPRSAGEYCQDAIACSKLLPCAEGLHCIDTSGTGDASTCEPVDVCFDDSDCPNLHLCQWFDGESSGRCVDATESPGWHCASCSDDVECEGGDLCIDGLCVPGFCRNDADCEGQVCVPYFEGYGSCVDWACRTDEQCGPGQVCTPVPDRDYGSCLGVDCADDSVCGPGDICVDGACARGCRDNSRCESDDACTSQDGVTAGSCRNVTCTLDDDCPNNTICASGSCSAEACRIDEVCGESASCELWPGEDTGFCEPTCTVDADCGDGAVCADGICRIGACRTAADCPSCSACRLSQAGAALGTCAGVILP